MKRPEEVADELVGYGLILGTISIPHYVFGFCSDEFNQEFRTLLASWWLQEAATVVAYLILAYVGALSP